MGKDLEKINEERAKLMCLYEIAPDEELAKKELLCLDDLDEVEEYVYTQLIRRGRPAIDVIKTLKSKFKISTMAASQLCHAASMAVFASVNTSTEFCQSLNECKEKIAQLNDLLEKTLEEGEDSEGNPEAIITEIREWTKIKNNLVIVGHQQNILAEAMKRRPPAASTGANLQGMTLEQLQELRGSL